MNRSGQIRETGARPAARERSPRRRLIATAGLVLLMSTGTAIRSQPGPAADARLPILDVHTHVFNLRYLPVCGILVARGVPKTVAAALARLLVDATPLANLGAHADELLNADLRDVGAMSDGEARSFVLGRLQRVQADRAPGAPAELLTRRERRAFRRYVAGEPARPAADQAPGETGDLALVAAALDKARFAPEREKSYPRFLATLMQDEVSIVRLAERTYPDVDLMVHHLMDLEHAYDDRPSLPNDGQIERLQPLARLFPGRLLDFVAFDPFRRNAALPVVRAAIESGAAIGVKFYPPSGYRAAGNGPWPPKPSWWKFAQRAQWNARYAGWQGTDLDRINDRLFAWAEANGVPILAHCTPEGFEAVAGYGEMADPRYWRPVLERFPKLRLVLAHAGGGESWFGDGAWTGEADFDQRAWDLATRYENVYLDFSYSNEVLDPVKLAALAARFRVLLPPSGDSRRPYALGDKVLYGSDWHMVSLLDGRKEILAALEGLFADPALAAYRVRFFAGNAVRFLRLAALAQDPRLDAAQRQALQAFVARVVAAGAAP